MSIIVCNRAPVPGSVGSTVTGSRCSLRSDSPPVLPDSPTLYTGFSSAWYEPTGVPEANSKFHFSLDVLLGNSDGEVMREMDAGWLRIEKDGDPNDNLKGTYFFGRLEAPAAPDDILMLEFGLKLNSSDVFPVPIGDQFTGVLFGFFINDTGLMVRFYHNNIGERWIEVFDGDQNSTQRVSPLTDTYKVLPAAYDWDGEDATYKILWDPEADVMQLILSSGEEGLLEDTVLIDGLVSDFPKIPVDQRRAHQPIAFFGHAYPGTNSISRWKGAWLYNDVFPGIRDGAIRGGQYGFIRSNDAVHLDVFKSPVDGDQPWIPLPASFDDSAGELVLGSEYLRLLRTDREKSYGFYRVEPGIDPAVVLDFALTGVMYQQESGLQASCFEIFVDDGTKSARVGFTYNLLIRTVGILGLNSPIRLDSYIGELFDWTVKTNYRLVFKSGIEAVLYRITETLGEIVYHPVGSVPYASLHDSSLPNPAIGFLHNALVGETLAEFDVYGLNYMANATLYEASSGSIPSWSKVGGGTTEVEEEVLLIEDTSIVEFTRFENAEAALTSAFGVSVDFRAKVDTYGEDGDNPLRTNTGVGVVLDDGSYKLVAAFADGGPELGRIVFLSIDEDIDDSLFKIRAGKEEAVDIYHPVDWTKFHLYRLERVVGGRVRLFIDAEPEPVIDIPFPYFSFPASEGSGAKIAFGSIQETQKNKSYWTHIYYSVSLGVDIMSNENIQDTSARYDKAVNIIARGLE